MMWLVVEVIKEYLQSKFMDKGRVRFTIHSGGFTDFKVLGTFLFNKKRARAWWHVTFI